LFLSIGITLGLFLFAIPYKIFTRKLRLTALESFFLASALSGLFMYFYSAIPSIILGDYSYLVSLALVAIIVPPIIIITYRRNGNILNALTLSAILFVIASIISTIFLD
jgi:hypothetical protein